MDMQRRVATCVLLEIVNGERGDVLLPLSTFGKVVIIILMFFGRLGLLTLLAAAARKEEYYQIDYPKADVTIG